ncbi:AEC family transporter [Candidatus Woesearchaeota archaeon]|nr:AEC family transporter [Candidatus Woesearchaeota archaeon]
MINVVAVIFCFVFLGWLSRKLNIMKKGAVDVLEGFVFFFGLPALIFNSLYKTDFSKIMDFQLLSVNLAGITLIIILMFVIMAVVRAKREVKAPFIVGSFFGNVAYMGIPLCQLAFGDEGGALAAIISVVYVLVGLTLGDIVFQYYSAKKPNIRRILVNILKIPSTWAVILGILFSFLSLGLPLALSQIIGAFSATAGPVALFGLGAFMFGNPVKGELLKKSIILSLIKTVLLPAIIFFSIRFFGLTGIRASVSLVQATVPLAVTNFVLAEEFKIGRRFVADSIIISTVLSIATISIMLYIV